MLRDLLSLLWYSIESLAEKFSAKFQTRVFASLVSGLFYASLIAWIWLAAEPAQILLVLWYLLCQELVLTVLKLEEVDLWLSFYVDFAEALPKIWLALLFIPVVWFGWQLLDAELVGSCAGHCHPAPGAKSLADLFSWPLLTLIGLAILNGVYRYFYWVRVWGDNEPLDQFVDDHTFLAPWVFYATAAAFIIVGVLVSWVLLFPDKAHPLLAGLWSVSLPVALSVGVLVTALFDIILEIWVWPGSIFVPYTRTVRPARQALSRGGGGAAKAKGEPVVVDLNDEERLTEIRSGLEDISYIASQLLNIRDIADLRRQQKTARDLLKQFRQARHTVLLKSYFLNTELQGHFPELFNRRLRLRVRQGWIAITRLYTPLLRGWGFSNSYLSKVSPVRIPRQLKEAHLACLAETEPEFRRLQKNLRRFLLELLPAGQRVRQIKRLRQLSRQARKKSGDHRPTG